MSWLRRVVPMSAVWVGVALVAACSGGDTTPDDSPTDPDDPGPMVDAPTSGVDDTGELPPKPPIDDAALFDPEHLVEVSLTLEPDDWDSLRLQTRELLDLLRGECLAEPFVSPFTYFEATATVAGQTLAPVGLRKKGLIGSLSETRPSLKIDTDRYVDDQFLDDGTERVTVNNQQQDPSRLHACLAYKVFADAGVPAPRCNFATVDVNGTDLGTYAHVEAIKSNFLKRHFSTHTGDLYEGTLSDFVAGWSESFAVKTDATDPDGPVIEALTEALTVPDDELLGAVDAVIDRDAFLTFWAVESLIAHWDGYAENTNNFYVYLDPGSELLSFVPWGADAVFEDPSTPAVFVNGRLANRLWNLPEVRVAYIERMGELLTTVWDEDALLAEIDRMEALIAPHVLDPTSVADRTEAMREFVRTRRGTVEAELATLGELGDFVRDPPCVSPIGGVTSTFTTTWESLLTDPFSPQFDATLDGDLVPPFGLLGATSGYDQGVPVVATLGITPDFTTLYQLYVAIYDWDLQPDTSYPLDLLNGVGYLFVLDLTDPYDEGEVVGLVEGSVTFEQVTMAPGAAVVGTIEGDVLEGLF